MTKPRVFYRGTDPEWTGPRIATGVHDWDRRLFVSSVRERAADYGPVLTVYEALPEARILYEGTRAYASVAKGLFLRDRPFGSGRMLDAMTEVVRRAEAQGYHAVWFRQQGNFGTVVIAPEMFASRPDAAAEPDAPRNGP